MKSATKEKKMAEGVGFEPTKLSFAGFQDRCTRPLCEPSVGEVTRESRELKIEDWIMQEVRVIPR